MNSLLISSVPGGKLMNLVRKLKELRRPVIAPCSTMNSLRMMKAVFENNGFKVEVRARRCFGREYLGTRRRRELNLLVCYSGEEG